MGLNNFDYGDLIRIIERQVELKINKIFPTGEWHLGKVASVISSKRLSVYVDGSSASQNIACNPDVAFGVGDEIFVIFVNGNQLDKFAICKRAV